MTNLRLVCAVATIVALSNLEMVNAGVQGQNDPANHYLLILVPAFHMRACTYADDDDDDDGECPEGGGSACDFEPTNRFNCGNNLQCPYRTICDLEAAGFDREDDCCQTVPENTACIQLFAPVICGDRECPYDNICFAEASGYDRAQCTRIDGSRSLPKEKVKTSVLPILFNPSRK